jgi:hypothetical protein
MNITSEPRIISWDGSPEPSGRLRRAVPRQQHNSRANVLVRLRCTGLLFASLLVTGIAAGQTEQKQGPAVLSIEGDKMVDGRVEVRLSSFVSVILSVEGPATLEVEPEKGAVTQSKFWQVRNAGDPETVGLPDNRIRWQRTYTVEPMNKGDLPLQVAPLRYRPQAGKGDWQSVSWKETTVHVTTTVPRADPSEARDITGPEQIPEANSPWIPVLRWSGVALVALALVLGALELRRRLAPRTPELPPHEWAVRELARLEGMGLPSHGQAERFHTLASDTIRRYLELRFHLRAPRQTTAEFLDAMRQSPQLEANQRVLLREFLERCDLAKFARAEYSVEECRATADMARTFVEQTKPAPPPVAAAQTERT